MDDSPGIAAENDPPRRRLLIDTIKDDSFACPITSLSAGDKHRIVIAALRYYDAFVTMDCAWPLQSALLYVDWIEERALSLTPSQQVVSNERLKSNFPFM